MSRQRHRYAIVGLAVAAIAGSLVFLRMPGAGDAEMFWLPWIKHVEQSGPIAAYSLSGTDYPPLIFVPFALIAAAQRFGISAFLALKLSLWICTWLTVGLFFMTTRSTGRAALLAAVVVVPSVALAYLDVYAMPTLILAIWLIRKERFSIGLLLLTATCLIKWQPLLLAPPFVIYAWHHLGARKAIRSMAPSVMFVAVCAVVVGPENILAAFERVGVQTVLSFLAMNAYWVLSRLMQFGQGGFDPTVAQMYELSATAILFLKLAFVAVYLRALIRFQPRSFEACLESAVTGVLIYFTFSPGVHENHLLTALVPAVWLIPVRRRYLGVALFAGLNILMFYGVSGGNALIHVPYLDLIAAPTFVAFTCWHMADLRERCQPRQSHLAFTGAAVERAT